MNNRSSFQIEIKILSTYVGFVIIYKEIYHFAE